jgi:type II pantothenate kinase
VADDADEADKALALINLVCQTIGVMAMFAARANGFKDIILTGKLTSIPQVKDVIEGVGKLFDVRFHIPRHADYATAIGAAIHLYNKERK